MWYTHPQPSHPPITWSNNIMTMMSLVQMGQCDRCGSVRNDVIFNSHLESGAGPWVSIPCLLQDTNHIYWYHLPKMINQEKTQNSEMRSNLQQIGLYYLGLCTQNPGLTEVDLEPSAKRGTNMTRALVNFYWLSGSWHLKKSSNQISHKSTKVDPVRSSSTWKRSEVMQDEDTCDSFFFHWIDLLINIVYLLLNLYPYRFYHIHTVYSNQLLYCLYISNSQIHVIIRIK